MERSDVEILAKETVYDGYFRIDRYRLRHRRHEGGWTGEIAREVFERGHVAAVLPYDPERDAVVLIEVPDEVLTEAGFLSRTKRGTWAYYRIVPGSLDTISGFFATV